MAKVIANKAVKLNALEGMIRNVTEISRSAYKLSTVHKDGTVTVRFRNNGFEPAAQFSSYLASVGIECEHRSEVNVSVNLNTIT